MQQLTLNRSQKLFLRRPFGKAFYLTATILNNTFQQISKQINIISQKVFKISFQNQIIFANGKQFTEQLYTQIKRKKTQCNILHLIDISKVNNKKISKITVYLNRLDISYLRQLQAKKQDKKYQIQQQKCQQNKNIHCLPQIQSIQVNYDKKIGQIIEEIYFQSKCVQNQLILSYIGKSLNSKNTFRQQLVQNGSHLYVIHKGMKKSIKKIKQKNKVNKKNKVYNNHSYQLQIQHLRKNNDHILIKLQNSQIFIEDGSQDDIISSSQRKAVSLNKKGQYVKTMKNHSQRQSNHSQVSSDSRNTGKPSKQMPSTTLSNSDNTLNNIDRSFCTKKQTNKVVQNSINSGYNQDHLSQLSPQNFSHSQNRNLTKKLQSNMKKPSILQNDISIVSERKSQFSMSESKSQYENGMMSNNLLLKEQRDKNVDKNQVRNIISSVPILKFTKFSSINGEKPQIIESQLNVMSSSELYIGKIPLEKEIDQKQQAYKKMMSSETNRNLPYLNLQCSSLNTLNLDEMKITPPSPNKKLIASNQSYRNIKKGEINIVDSEIVSFIDSILDSKMQQTLILKQTEEVQYQYDPFQNINNSPMKKSKEKKVQYKPQPLDFLVINEISQENIKQNEKKFMKKINNESQNIPIEQQLDLQLKHAIQQNNWYKNQNGLKQQMSMKTSLKVKFKNHNTKAINKCENKVEQQIFLEPNLKQPEKNNLNNIKNIYSQDLTQFCAIIDNYTKKQKQKLQSSNKYQLEIIKQNSSEYNSSKNSEIKNQKQLLNQQKFIKQKCFKSQNKILLKEKQDQQKQQDRPNFSKTISQQTTVKQQKNKQNSSKYFQTFDNIQGISIIEDFSVFFEDAKKCQSDQQGFYKQQENDLFKKSKLEKYQEKNKSPKKLDSLIYSQYSKRPPIRQFRNVQNES